MTSSKNISPMAWSRRSLPRCPASVGYSLSRATRPSPTRAQAIDVKQVGRELGVRYVLEGSVRKAANRVRITAQLIDTISGAHLWAERYDRESTPTSASPARSGSEGPHHNERCRSSPFCVARRDRSGHSQPRCPLPLPSCEAIFHRRAMLFEIRGFHRFAQADRCSSGFSHRFRKLTRHIDHRESLRQSDRITRPDACMTHGSGINGCPAPGGPTSVQALVSAETSCS